VKTGYVAQEQYEQTRAAADAARATARADEAAVENARLELSYTRVTAPIAGRTGSIQVHAGNMLREDDDRTLVTINQIRPIGVTFTVPETSFDAIRRAQAESKLSVAASPSGEPGAAERAERGELSFIDNAVDRATGTVRLKATFANASAVLWPGRFVDVVLTLARDPGALVIPAEAVQTGQQGSYVFVVKADSTVESRSVTVARTQGGNVVIARGLSADERVVTDGHLRLAPGVKVEIKQSSGAAS
jgi:multidrug efflux system membrane fusion protein